LEQALKADSMTIRRQRIDEDLARKIGTMLDLDESSLWQGQTMPVGWHFPLIGCETARKDLRADGFPGLGVPMPDLGLPRTAAAGRTVHFNRPLRFDAEVTRKSSISSIKHKDGTAGPLAIVTVAHEIWETTPASDQPPAIYEEQTYVLLSSPFAGAATNAAPVALPLNTIKTVTPDETLLFQFSALSFNTHKIHLDRDFACTVEGYPDLVVNGGLVTLLMTEIVRLDLRQAIRSLTVRNKAPLFCNRPIAFVAEQTASGLRIAALDHEGHLAAEMEAVTYDL
jgi:3-methylfumaryl-CoA hydratase